MKGFWRIDKFKDHMKRKHPEIDFECWYCWEPNGPRGYRDIEKRAQHEILMKSKGYIPIPGSRCFRKMSAAEKAAAGSIH